MAIFPEAAAIMLAVALSAAASGVADASETRFDPFRISVTNSTGSDLYCQALAARWYAFELGIIARQASLVVDMAVDVRTKTIVIFNHRKLALPIRTLFCGYGGREWETKFIFSLNDIARAAASDRTIAFACRDDHGKPACS